MEGVVNGKAVPVTVDGTGSDGVLIDYYRWSGGKGWKRNDHY